MLKVNYLTPSILDRAWGVMPWPFPHIVVQDCLPEDYYLALEKARPRDEWITRTKDSNRRVDVSARECLRRGVPEIWKEFIEYHVSPEFWLEVAFCFGDYIRAAYPRLEWEYGPLMTWEPGIRGMTDRHVFMDCQIGLNTPPKKEGRVRGPHLDNPVELIGALLYMDDTDGNLLLYEAKQRPTFYGKKEIPDDQVEAIAEVECRKNTLVMFMNHPSAIHGVTPRKVSEQSRRLVSICTEMRQPLF